MQAQVRHADLDLASPAGRATSGSRLRTAARMRCGVAVTANERRCQDDMMKDGRAQVNALLGARATQVAAR